MVEVSMWFMSLSDGRNEEQPESATEILGSERAGNFFGQIQTGTLEIPSSPVVLKIHRISSIDFMN